MLFRSPKANILLERYDDESQIRSIRVTDIENVVNGTASVSLAIWMNEDQSDLYWIQMEIQDDNSYYSNIDFGDRFGMYHIQAYVMDGAGDQYMLAELTESISQIY